MRTYSLDFGGSTVDVAVWEDGHLLSTEAHERHAVSTASLESFLNQIDPSLDNVERVFVTGGKSHRYTKEVSGIPVTHVDEIQAIGRGGQWLWHSMESFQTVKECLVVSLGTGTCLVSAKEGGFAHVGGTGVGGGTFLGLCALLLHEKDPERLVAWFRQGNPRHVDVSVGEIVGRGIGRVSSEHTASNLGKLGFKEEILFEKEDLAAGIVNLIGQTIAISAVFAARAEGLSTLVLTGKLTRIAPIVEIIDSVARWYNLSVVIPPRAEYGSAIGAGLVCL